ncbi:nuclear transport factor 2 family protein [Actinoallomurus sp. CA-150999]|uniref:nuclear transport factor 2 family protein n=1 Tax=Actinoallomurus sp. CA-150999 TaxID=3239887 RepID=UPI003D8A11EC
MYRMFVRHNVRAAFAALSQGSMDLVNAMSPDVHHTFPSTGALGGERSNRADVAAWLERLYRVLPGLRFDVRSVAVAGWPWDTTVGVEWTNTATLLDGSTYTNTGAHILHIHNGKITSFHAYLHDVDAIDDALAHQAAGGIDEATAPPIVSTGSGAGR